MVKIATPATMSDMDIVRSYLRTQDTSWVGLLYDRYSNKVYFKCISLLKDEHLARDAVQEVFTKILLNLSKFNEKSQFSTWVYSITYNYCIDLLRRKKKGKLLFSDDLEEAERQTPIVSDEDFLSMELDVLRQVLNVIPEGDKAILMMKYYDDMSIKEIADALDKTESSIKMKIMRAKAKAADCYQDIMKRQK
jgi:RNA polymerase sigma factor (sigma-70 family)